MPQRQVMECPRGWTTAQWARFREKIFRLAEREFTGSTQFEWKDGVLCAVRRVDWEDLREPPRTAAPDVAPGDDL